jgi:HAD superfamily hydrolase (TIGR01509 family)
LNKKGYIFDMDGTLIDSMPMWYSINEEFLSGMGVQFNDDVAREIGPMSVVAASDYLIKRFGLPVTARELTDAYMELLHRKYKTVVTVKDGVRDFLQKCKEEGIPMCVATATETPLALEAMETHGLLPYMEFLISCEDVGKSKRDPDIYLEAARRLNLEPKETAVFEDVFYGAETAKKAGFSVVGVHDSMVAEEEAMALRQISDCYIHSFTELL